jgi:hypothetical protein
MVVNMVRKEGTRMGFEEVQPLLSKKLRKKLEKFLKEKTYDIPEANILNGMDLIIEALLEL